MPDTRHLPSEKHALRLAMKTRRAEAKVRQPDASLILKDLFLKAVTLPAGCVISAYVARNAEMDALPLATALHARGHALCLPAAAGRDEPLRFRAFTPGDGLAPQGTMNLYEPLPAAPLCEPDVLIVPLLAFDGALHRLGYGGGHYDRTLAALRAQKPILAVGIAYACQEVPALPAEFFDARLDKIVTEIQVFET
ncbi:MAG TPA: 5-formyltetrahydrofolate cyclo-ligase [Alphaproteobacteria bacterium]|nr:5-formyltetrahydrofolate cyclo-ligase [Alphaproteobacteria bacterium]